AGEVLLNARPPGGERRAQDRAEAPAQALRARGRDAPEARERERDEEVLGGVAQARAAHERGLARRARRSPTKPAPTTRMKTPTRKIGRDSADSNFTASFSVVTIAVAPVSSTALSIRPTRLGPYLA